MPYLKSENIDLYYDEFGQGDPLILLHGFSLDRRMWADQIDTLAEYYLVITPDARGHGKSESPRTGYARENRVMDILNLADHLEIDKFHLVGMSMGGGDALAFGIDHVDRLHSLTLIGTVASGWKPSKQFHDFTPIALKSGIARAKEEYIKSILSYYRNKDADIKDRLETMMNGFSGTYWIDPMKGKYLKRDDVALAGRVTVPTLLIVGKKDIFFTPLAEKLDKALPDSEKVVISGAGHMVNMEAPNRFNELLLRFLRRTSGR